MKKKAGTIPESTLEVAGAIAANPQLANKVDLSVLNGYAWAILLSVRPEMASQCDFTKFAAADWISLLSRQPQLAEQVRFAGSPFDSEDFKIDLEETTFERDDRVRHVAKASTIHPYGKWEYVLDGADAIITGVAERGQFEWDDKIEELKIPAKIDGYRVVGTGESAFQCFNALRRVALANGVKFVGPCSFVGCDKLVSVSLPNSIVEIQPQAFSRCSSLSSVNIPSRVKYIGYNAFDKTDLVEVIIPDSVVELDNYAFKDCSRLKKFVIGRKIKVIGIGVLDGCLALRQVKTGIKNHHLRPNPYNKGSDWVFKSLMRGDRIRF